MKIQERWKIRDSQGSPAVENKLGSSEAGGCRAAWSGEGAGGGKSRENLRTQKETPEFLNGSQIKLCVFFKDGFNSPKNLVESFLVLC